MCLPKLNKCVSQLITHIKFQNPPLFLWEERMSHMPQVSTGFSKVPLFFTPNVKACSWHCHFQFQFTISHSVNISCPFVTQSKFLVLLQTGSTRCNKQLDYGLIHNGFLFKTLHEWGVRSENEETETFVQCKCNGQSTHNDICTKQHMKYLNGRFSQKCQSNS